MQLRHIPRELSRFVRRGLGIKPPPSEAFLQIISVLKPGDTFVDVGANIGEFSLHAAERVGPTGRVLAIEPNPAVVKELRIILARRGIANVEVVPVAIGEEVGTATLYVFKHHARSSLYRDGRANRYTAQNANRERAVTVTVEPLALVLATLGITRVDALKIDVEGYEDRALIPFFEKTPEQLWPRRILIERSPHIWKIDCIGYMLGRGYREAWHGAGDTLLVLQC
jgi:FkbM family methyltransferase